MLGELDRRRHLMYSRLNEIEGIKCTLPEGAFYAFPNIESLNVSSEQVANRLAKDARVLTVPGSCFGSGGEGHLRLSYSSSLPSLEEALNRMSSAIERLRVGSD
jgi:aminotransferase